MIWLLACAHPAAVPAWRPEATARTWASGSLTVVDATTIEEVHILQVRATDLGVELRTVRSEITVEGRQGRQRFDSAAPTGGDPWPLVLQHLVSSVPATVRDGPGGVELVDPALWSDAAKDELFRASLPPQVASAGLPLIDPDGFTAAARRMFPPVPTEGALDRPERIASIEASRQESCVATREAALRRWRCEGTITDPEGRLREVSSFTEFVTDRAGLLSVESGYEGLLALSTGIVPVGARRRVERLEFVVE